MSHSPTGDGGVDIDKVMRNNPKVDLEKVREARDLLQALRKQGLSPRGYTLAPPYRRQMHVTSKHLDEVSDEVTFGRAGGALPRAAE